MVKEKNKNLLSMAEYAKKRNVSYNLIRRYCKVEPIKITLIDGKIDPDLADRELEENLNINGNSKLAKGAVKEITSVNYNVEFNKAKARREKSKADLAELEYKEKAGKLIPVNQVEKEAEDLYRRYRDQMLNVVVRATKKLLGETSEFKFRKDLKKEIENAIKQVK
ncbi:MAG: hypothetical protein GY928_25830 [Colwellia sp.]|nr:hypothetical protein [Colwellia sp.]